MAVQTVKTNQKIWEQFATNWYQPLHMRRKWFLFVGFSVLFGAGVLEYLYLSGRTSFLVLNSRATIGVKGALVQGELREGHAAAIVTMREAGKKHSYALFFEGDTDFTGDMGFVVDCGQWVATHLPLSLVTRNYPPCRRVFGGASDPGRLPLIDKGKSMQFVLKDQSTITIQR